MFEPDAQSPEVVQPSEGTLNNPPGLAEATAVWLATAGDLRGDADSVKVIGVFVVIVAAIGLHHDGL